MPPTLNILKDATSRDFSGGLNVSDTELNLSSKFARVLENMKVGIDGSLQKRQGTRLHADFTTLTDYDLVDIEYFFTRLITVDERGQVLTSDGQGNIARIWDSAIATATRAGLAIWASANQVRFEEFNGELYIANGADKPLLVTTAYVVDYAADKATGSNINVPVALIVKKFSQHLCWADGSMLFVSEKNAGGTYLGDVGTQFANNFDMKTYVVKGSTDIIGLTEFKGYLMVHFRECIVPVQFNEITTGTPPVSSLGLNVAPDSVLANYGAISSRTQQDIGDSTLSCDIVGVASVSLSKFTKVLAPDRPSRLIDAILQTHINELSSDTLKLGAFSVYDRKQAAYLLFLPDETQTLQLNSTCYSYHYINSSNVSVTAWSYYTGWNWRGGCRSSEGNMFFIRNNDRTVFVVGNSETNPMHADFIGEQETFSDGTAFDDNTGFGPVADINDSGLPIKWAWELPWTDLKHRGLSKTLRYIMMDAEGDAEFNVKVFVDNMRTLRTGGEPFSDGTLFDDATGWIPLSQEAFTYALSIDMTGKDRGGFGFDGYGNLYGGGNNASTQLLTEAPTKGKLLKLRFEGESVDDLKFVAITLFYQVGNARSFGI